MTEPAYPEAIILASSVARIFRIIRPDSWLQGHFINEFDRGAYSLSELLITDFADCLQQKNESFDRKAFIEACSKDRTPTEKGSKQ